MSCANDEVGNRL